MFHRSRVRVFLHFLLYSQFSLTFYGILGLKCWYLLQFFFSNMATWVAKTHRGVRLSGVLLFLQRLKAFLPRLALRRAPRHAWKTPLKSLQWLKNFVSTRLHYSFLVLIISHLSRSFVTLKTLEVVLLHEYDYYLWEVQWNYFHLLAMQIPEFIQNQGITRTNSYKYIWH